MTDSELNEAVARKLGWKECQCAEEVRDHHKSYMPSKHIMPRYSTDISAAWEIVEKLQKDGFTLSLSWCTVGDHFEWTLKIMGHEFTSEWADTAPRAICEAFLKLP